MRPESFQHLTGRQYQKWCVEGILLEESAVKPVLNFQTVFGNRHPVELEIGIGKGTFLLARAAARPEINLLGIEYARPYAAYAADRARRAELGNVRIIHGDALDIVAGCIPPGSLMRIHIYFPDPWPKQRHHRRRLIQSAFIDHARRALQVGGQLIIVTDHLEYFSHIRNVLNRARGFATISMPAMSNQEGEIVGTNFERKYIASGRAFFSTARIRYE